MLDLDLRPVGVQLLGNQHRQGGPDALAHLGMCEQHGHAVIAAHAQEGIGRETPAGAGRLRRRKALGTGYDEGDHQAARDERAGLEEFTPGRGRHLVHETPPFASAAARCTTSEVWEPCDDPWAAVESASTMPATSLG